MHRELRREAASPHGWAGIGPCLFELPRKKLDREFFGHCRDEAIKIIEKVGHDPTLDDPALPVERPDEPDSITGFHETGEVTDFSGGTR